MVKIASEFILENAIPPRMEVQRQKAIESLSIDIKEWELVGLTVEIAPWLPVYEGMGSDLTLGVLWVRRRRVKGGGVVRMAVVDGGGLYLLWGELYDDRTGSENDALLSEHKVLEDALDELRRTVKQWC